MYQDKDNYTSECQADLFPLLGYTKEHLLQNLGEPIAEYPHRGKNILLFEHNGDTVSCEIENNTVISINTFKDRRSPPRIKPSRTKKAFLRAGQDKLLATIIDLSVNSVSMKIEGSEELPAKGAFITFCTNLRTKPLTRVYVNLAGKVHSVDNKNRKIVIIIHAPFQTHSHRALQDYINAQQALLRLGGAIKPAAKPRKDDYVKKDVTIIKSDICVMCQEGLCGIAFDPFREEPIPEHKGRLRA